MVAVFAPISRIREQMRLDWFVALASCWNEATDPKNRIRWESRWEEE